MICWQNCNGLLQAASPVVIACYSASDSFVTRSFIKAKAQVTYQERCTCDVCCAYSHASSVPETYILSARRCWATIYRSPVEVPDVVITPEVGEPVKVVVLNIFAGRVSLAAQINFVPE